MEKEKKQKNQNNFLKTGKNQRTTLFNIKVYNKSTLIKTVAKEQTHDDHSIGKVYIKFQVEAIFSSKF